MLFEINIENELKDFWLKICMVNKKYLNLYIRPAGEKTMETEGRGK